jgi:hypothetical protein
LETLKLVYYENIWKETSAILLPQTKIVMRINYMPQTKIVMRINYMKHELWHRHGYFDTLNVKNIYKTSTLIYIYKIFKLKIKIYTCASKLNKVFIRKSFERIYDMTFELYSSIYYQKAKNNLIKT